jgi:hypothetical protein
MTRPSEPHLSAEEIDAWLNGALDLEWLRHLERCPSCMEQARIEREIAEQIAALPLMSPREGFADRVMASVAIPDPFAIRALQATRRRLFGTRKSLAFAAGIALFLVASMTGSIVWTLGNQEVLASVGSWLLSQGSQVAWLGLRGLASNFIEQPWYESLKLMLENPARLALVSAVATFAYLGGVFALRRLLAVPTQRVAHVGL